MDGHNTVVSDMGVASGVRRWWARCDRCDIQHTSTLSVDHARRAVTRLHNAREADRAAETRRAVEHDLGIKLGGRS